MTHTYTNPLVSKDVYSYIFELCSGSRGESVDV